ncbi:MAG: SpoIIE family protein phosphatase [Bacteroidetes bacterium]|nr:SpoIIE family protein phosphatase [Bacteroidota bacterium]
MNFRKGGLTLRYSLFFLSAILFIFTIAFFYTFEFTMNILDNDAMQRASNITDLTISRITNVIRPIEQVPHALSSALVSEKPDYNNIMEITKDFVKEDSVVFGSALAFEPYMHDAKHYRYCPYIFETGNKIIQKDLSTAEYDYFSKDWYRIPKMLGTPVWSEPYYDKGGGDTLMCTYSVPFYREIKGKRTFAGVITMDISLKTFKHILTSAKVYQTGFSFLVSHGGKFITYPHEEYINTDILDLIRKSGDPQAFKTIEKMLNGERLFDEISNFEQKQVPAWIYFAPVPLTGWIFALTFPTKELYSGLYSFFKKLALIFILSLVAMIIISVMITRKFTKPISRLVDAAHRIGQGDFNANIPVYRAKDEIAQLTNAFSGMKQDLVHYINNLRETTIEKEKIESELSIAHIIQMGLLPRNFPDREDCELYAILDPARAVGGDLYDFYFLDADHLFIAIGDVSGKGVPASLFMATTRTFFRSKVSIGTPIQQTVAEINMEICKENPNQMFVTLIAGIIDLRSGSMTYCNAGHNPPILIHSSGDTGSLNDIHGIPLGIFDSAEYSSGTIRFETGDLFFLYTDGVTEAVRKDDAFYGEERMIEVIRNNHSLAPADLIKHIEQDVREWMKDVEQADDIAILVVKYKGRKE